jgi:Zn-dependent protease
VSTSASDLTRTCKQCSRELAPGARACEQCHTLVYAAELDRLAAEANALEAQGQLRQAREHWLKALPLLPRASNQAQWVRDHSRALEAAAEATEPPEPENKWINKLGPVGPIAILLAKSKTLLLAVFKLKFLFSFAAFIGVYWGLWGLKFGVGFAVLILLHELGHFIDIRRRGLPAELPVFLPGLGAYVQWDALGVPLETRAAVSLAGPFAGLLAAIGCAALWRTTGSPIWAALARSGAWLNILNLIPIWTLDGAHAALALGKAERLFLLTAALALWLVLGENVFFLVMLGTAWRLFTKDLPSHSSTRTLVYFVAVLSLLGVVMWLMPNQGFPR